MSSGVRVLPVVQDLSGVALKTEVPQPASAAPVSEMRGSLVSS